MNEFKELDLNLNTRIGKPVLFFTIIDSTNDFLKNKVDQYPEGTVVWANWQTAGRGRFDRIWESPEGKGLYFSLLLKPQIPLSQVSIISLMMSLALKKGIEDHLNKLITQPHFAIDIKWPNDLLVEGKKIAGILIENVITGDRPHLIVGIGLNTSTGEEDFISADVKISAASLKRFFPVTLNHTELLKDIIISIDNMYNNLKAEDIVSEYRENIRFSGKYCRLELPEGVVEGICQGISDRGELIISNSDGQKKYLSGTLDLKF